MPQLQSLRFLFVSLIFLSHFSWGERECLLPAGGDCGVAFFFMLSGFVLTLAAKAEQPTGAFLRSRLRKIYPPYLISLLVAFVLVRWSFSKANLLPLLTLTQSWFPCQAIFYGGDAPAWFLSDILFLYVIFKPLHRAIFAAKPLWLALIVLCFIALYTSLLQLVPTKLQLWAIYVFPIARIPDFALGIALCRLYNYLRKTYGSFPGRTTSCLQFLAVAVMLATLWSWHSVPEACRLALIFWLPSSAVILSFAIPACTKPILVKLLTHKALVWLGNLSMEIYLLHVPIIIAAQKIAKSLALDISTPIALAAVAAIVIVSSFLLHLFLKYLNKYRL